MKNITEKIECAKDINIALRKLLVIAQQENDIQMLAHIAKISDDMKPMLDELNLEISKTLN